MAKEANKENVEEAESPEVDSNQDLLKQIQNEYKVAHDYMHPKFQTWYLRLKLLNNQKRDNSIVGDPLLFTIFYTVLASLYDDRLGVNFNGREEGDDPIAENLNNLAEYDYDEMEKAQIDYDWMFDSGFYGRGLLLMHDWDAEALIPLPEVLNPMLFLRDPKATSINGNRKGAGAARFCGWFTEMTKAEMDDIDEFDTTKIVKGSSIDSLVKKATEARAEAQGHNDDSNLEKQIDENEAFEVLVWMTHVDGVKKVVWTSHDRKVVYRTMKLKRNRFPIIDRPLYPISHDFDGISIPDIVEDKQRARSVLINLGIKHAKADIYPMYVFDTNKIKNRADLNFDFNKFIPVSGDVDKALRPMQKAQMSASVDFILRTLDESAQRATATPEMQSGVVSETERTLGELNLVSAKVGIRYSLTAKIFGWSEKLFWAYWYDLLEDNFTEANEKSVRISGMFHNSWKTFGRKDLVGNQHPDIDIESRVVSDAKRQLDLRNFTNYAALILAREDDGGHRYVLKRLGKLNGLKKDELDRVLPKNIDEIIAEEENEMLAKGKMVAPKADENPVEHLAVHMNAPDNPAKEAHIKATYALILMRRNKPDIFPEFDTSPVAEAPKVRATIGGEPEATSDMNNVPSNSKAEEVNE